MNNNKISKASAAYNGGRRSFLQKLITSIVALSFLKTKSWAQLIPFSFWKNSSGGGGATSGLLFSWGSALYGLLGDGTTTNKSSPVQIGALTNWKELCSYESSISSAVIKSDGTLWTFGNGSWGCLGDSTTVSKSSPVQVGTLTDWKQVSCGVYAVSAVKTDGTLWAWGSANYGALGNGAFTYIISAWTSSPIQIGALTNWKQVSSGTQYTLAVKTDGTLWAWGLNTSGQLGNGEAQINYSNLTQVGSNGEWSSADFHTPSSSTVSGGVGITPAGNVKTWGDNTDGQLGDGTTVLQSSPIVIGSLTNWSQISAGDTFNMAVKTDGTLWGWGDNASGQLGIGNTTFKSSPVQIGALTNWSQISCSGNYAGAIKVDGTLWTWGDNGDGQLGLGNTTSKSSPVQVGALTNWSKIATSSGFSGNEGSRIIATKTDGTLWAWGINTNGQLGDSTVVDKSSPIQIGALTNWGTSIAVGNSHNLAVKTDGTLWAWGVGASGKLGDGTSSNKSSPIQIGALTNWSKVAAGTNHSLAIKTDGTLWAWGSNISGQLGTGDLTIRSSPVQIGAATDWVFINAKENSSLAINSLGGMYVFGDNNNNLSFGLGLTLPNRSSPIQIGALTNWAKVFASNKSSFAIKTDGTLWSWGSNTSGQLGLGDITNRSSPVQVGALTNWSNLGASWQSTFNVGVKTDGTLWSWGTNSSGQLGLGDTTSRSSPVQIGALTNWKKIAIGTSSCVALKTNGTLWAWGLNSSGQLGKGDTTSRSSPVQIGTETTWLDIGSAENTGYGIRT